MKLREGIDSTYPLSLFLRNHIDPLLKESGFSRQGKQYTVLAPDGVWRFATVKPGRDPAYVHFTFRMEVIRDFEWQHCRKALDVQSKIPSEGYGRLCEDLYPQPGRMPSEICEPDFGYYGSGEGVSVCAEEFGRSFLADGLAFYERWSDPAAWKNVR